MARQGRLSEMPTLGNLSFETAGAGLGDATSWTRAAIYTAQEIAEFNTTAGLESRFESFEVEWSSNEDFLFLFTDPDIDAAVWDTSLPTPEVPEDFEEGWSNNEIFGFALSAISGAVFDSETMEDFEESWSTNESWSDVLGGVTAAIYDSVGTPETVEDFEEIWSANGSWSDLLATFGLTAASFDSGGTPEAVEDFEETYTDVAFLVIVGSDQVTIAGHNLLAGETVQFRNVGGVLPGGLSPTYTYFIANVIDVNNIDVQGVSGGPVTGITDNGIGTHYLMADPTKYWRLEP